MANKNDEATVAPVQEPEKVKQTETAEVIQPEEKPKAKRVNLKKELAKQKGSSATGYTAYIRARIKAGK